MYDPQALAALSYRRDGSHNIGGTAEFPQWNNSSGQHGLETSKRLVLGPSAAFPDTWLNISGPRFCSARAWSPPVAYMITVWKCSMTQRGLLLSLLTTLFSCGAAKLNRDQVGYNVPGELVCAFKIGFLLTMLILTSTTTLALGRWKCKAAKRLLWNLTRLLTFPGAGKDTNGSSLDILSQVSQGSDGFRPSIGTALIPMGGACGSRHLFHCNPPLNHCYSPVISTPLL